MGGIGGWIGTGIISGAAQGANNYFDKQQQSQNAYNNAANLAGLNANLEVQKNASILANQRAFQNQQLDDYKARYDAENSNPQPPTQAPISTSSNPAPAPAISGLDMSKVSPQDMALMQKDPKFLEGMQNGLSDFNATTAAQLPTLSAPTNFQSTSTAPTNNGMPTYKQIIGAKMVDAIIPNSGTKIIESTLPTEQQRNDKWAGITPQQRSAIANKIELKPNNTYGTLGPDGKPILQYVAADPDSNAQYKVNQDGTITANGIDGLAQAHADLTATKLKAQNLQTMASPEMQRRDKNGAIIPTNEQQLADISNSGSNQTVGLIPGQEKAATLSQDDLSKKWNDLNTANGQAQTTISYLQSIKDLSGKTATGQFSDRLQYVNSLLSMVGDAKATDEASARNLLDKYGSQIVARLGSGGGMQTDSARAIIQSAYPNAHMTPQAISEAVDNLIGATNMTKAKASLLAPAWQAKDPATYQSKELTFDQNADPRIWQWQGIQDPAKKAAFAQGLIKQDPTIPQKIHVLESIGAIR